jgi:hypothetical protein
MTENEVFELALTVSNEIADKYGADASELAMYLTGIARVESNYNPSAKNKKSTARGLLQMLICTQREIEKKYANVEFAPAMVSCKNYPDDIVAREYDKIFNPDYAMFLSAIELGRQYKRYGGDWFRAVHAYNQGSAGKLNIAGKLYANKVILGIQRFASNVPFLKREYY